MKQLIIDSYTGQRRIALAEYGSILEFRVEPVERLYGNIYKGRVVNIVPGLEAAFVDIGYKKNAYLPLKKNEMNKIAPGNFAIVQVTKESIGKKGPKLTMDITLPGRYLVLMPFANNIGISHRIDSEEEKKKLREKAKQLKPGNMGIIMRTNAADVELDELRFDLKKLLDKWAQILSTYEMFTVPVPLYRDVSMLENSLMDMVTSDTDEIVVNSVEDFEYLHSYLSAEMPSFLPKLKMRLDPNIFKSFGIEDSIENIFMRKINLKSGGYIVIDTTEALTVIDVNSGKFTSKETLEETVFAINLEAAEEIARQIKLRDIGGIIIIDFIDMSLEESRNALIGYIKELVKKDRVKTNVVDITALGLVELTRKKEKDTNYSYFVDQCPYCHGRGWVFTEEYLLSKIKREIIRLAQNFPDRAIVVELNPFMMEAFTEGNMFLIDLKNLSDSEIIIKDNRNLTLDGYKIYLVDGN
ncbi:MAG: Rne/Rng family ribonuclease [Thermoanaerobacteraceae bacterium]|nr:Rne/Rng family ribonuclease [Thermoanaerobacteraceae bacterium]